MLVSFENFDESKDEVLFKSSSRLAKYKTYTSRQDIPRYQPNKKKGGPPIVINRPSNVQNVKPKSENKKNSNDTDVQLDKLYKGLSDQTIQQNNLQKWAQTQNNNQQPVHLRDVMCTLQQSASER